MRELTSSETKLVFGGDNPGQGPYGDRSKQERSTGGAFGPDGRSLDRPSNSGSNGKDRCTNSGDKVSSNRESRGGSGRSSRGHG